MFRILRSLVGTLLVVACLVQGFVLAQTSKAGPQHYVLSQDDDAFLEDFEHRTFLFFWEHSDPNTGLTLDRARTSGNAPAAGDSHYRVASIAATGFALTGYCIAAKRGWITRSQAIDRTRRTLHYFADEAFNKRGWFYHWQDQATGERRWKSEISSIDTALLLGGVLTVRQCFNDDPLIVRDANKIYRRVDFRWMLNGNPSLLSHGWKPETGFLENRWHDYSEQAILNLLAIGSPTHPIPWQSWYAWKREYKSYGKYRYLAAVPPLFIHQYSHAWVDFRGKRERYKSFNTDYYENSIMATRAQRQFFIDVLSKEFPKYGENIWGLTASDAVDGYKAWGAPPKDPTTDGTVVPYAPAGSLMFTPDISVPALKEMKATYGGQIYGRYGFADAFNPHTGWVDTDVIGIDLGIAMLSSENLRSESVWHWFMRDIEIKKGLHRAKIQ